ncbi:MAG: fluoride efflux transporter CrcB [Pseudomonadota bacterium]
MQQVLLIAVGGALGAVMRYWTSTTVHQWLGRDFPYGTLVVNVLGSLAIGALYVLLVERVTTAPELRALLLIGFLGAFTTFSTFSIETLQLLEEGAVLRASLNMAISVMACVAAAWLGVIAGRSL